MAAVRAATEEGIDVVPRTSAAYVSLSVRGDHPIALFAHKNRVSVSLDRQPALEANREHPFCELQPGEDGAPTRHVRINNAPIRLNPAVSAQLFVAALRRSHSRTGRDRVWREPVARRPDLPEPESCPIHFVHLANGKCDRCEE